MKKSQKTPLSVSLFLAILLLAGYDAESQIAFKPYDSVVLTISGEPIKNPWAGGFNSPQFSSIDLNQDGIKDLVTFERSFYGVFKTYIQNGAEGQSDWQYDPRFQNQFPTAQNWTLLVDYDCDGHEDMFTSVPGGIKVYHNDYTVKNNNRFRLVTAILQTVGLDGPTPLFVSPPDLPAFTDVDGDGDMDILTFEKFGNTVEYHKNMSIEKYGNCDSLLFELQNACWGYFSENPINNSINLFDTCENNVGDPEKSIRHAGSTLLGIDINGNNVTDLLLGDISYKNLSLLTNGGTPQNASMISTDAAFPSNSVPVDIEVFPAAFYLDANNDGISDLLVTPNNPNTSVNTNNIWFYENQGSQNLPEFIFRQNNFLQESMVDLGAGSFPVFFDENADGLMDIIAGNYGYFIDGGNYRSQLALFRNTGSSAAPQFEFANPDYGNFSVMGFNGMYPAFGDLDGDNDADMIVGDEDGLLHYFVNEAGAGNPASFVLSQANFRNIDVGQSAKPQIVDVNKDGLPDLLVGERSGTVNYFKNTGNLTSPDFTQNPTIETFGNIDVMPDCCTGFSAPFLTADSTGKMILYVGSEQGYLYLFNNIENNINGTFNLVDSLYLGANNVNVDGSDLNGDGNTELVYGQYTGGIALLQKGFPEWIGMKEKKENDLNLVIYPNPASKKAQLKLDSPVYASGVEVRIFDIMGQLVEDLQFRHQTTLDIDCSALKPGIYIVVANTEKQSGFTKLLIR